MEYYKMIHRVFRQSAIQNTTYPGGVANYSASMMHSERETYLNAGPAHDLRGDLPSPGFYDQTQSFASEQVFYSPEYLQYYGHQQMQQEVAADEDMYTWSLSDDDDKALSVMTKQSETDVPYATLIYRALMSVPEHRMILQDIYDWFRNNTDKPNTGSVKGWQNSIRHNLSMNEAFVKLEPDPTTSNGKKGCLWALRSSAIGQGVESTTRYRKDKAHKRASHNDPTASARVKQSAKGKQGQTRSAAHQNASDKAHAPPVVLPTPQRVYDSAILGDPSRQPFAHSRGYLQEQQIVMTERAARFDDVAVDTGPGLQALGWPHQHFHSSIAEDHLAIEHHLTLASPLHPSEGFGTTQSMETSSGLSSQMDERQCQRMSELDGCLPPRADMPLFVSPEAGLVERMLLEHQPCRPGSHHAISCPGSECRV